MKIPVNHQNLKMYGVILGLKDCLNHFLCLALSHLVSQWCLELSGHLSLILTSVNSKTPPHESRFGPIQDRVCEGLLCVCVLCVYETGHAQL